MVKVGALRCRKLVDHRTDRVFDLSAVVVEDVCAVAQDGKPSTAEEAGAVSLCGWRYGCQTRDCGRSREMRNSPLCC